MRDAGQGQTSTAAVLQAPIQLGLLRQLWVLQYKPKCCRVEERSAGVKQCAGWGSLGFPQQNSQRIAVLMDADIIGPLASQVWFGVPAVQQRVSS